MIRAVLTMYPHIYIWYPRPAIITVLVKQTEPIDFVIILSSPDKVVLNERITFFYLTTIMSY